MSWAENCGRRPWRREIRKIRRTVAEVMRTVERRRRGEREGMRGERLCTSDLWWVHTIMIKLMNEEKCPDQ